MQKKRKVLMFVHGGNRNRGCEAILRSTCAMLGQVFPDVETTVISHEYKNDSYCAISGVKEYLPTWGYKEWTPAWFLRGISRRLNLDLPDYLEQLVGEHDLCMSIGGDNYCYREFFPSLFIQFDRLAKRCGKPLVLWGASIEKDLITGDIREDFRSFDLISIRESISYQDLLDLKINDQVFLYPDPAFTMPAGQIKLPEKWIDGDTIGINLSPLIMRYETQSGLVMNTFIALIETILKTTRSAVALIPHVFLDNGNDLAPLQQLYHRFKDTNRVILMGNHLDATELKAAISNCRLFIGVRTHATIAAYSSQVPTLALGYSVKARGIARDLFGDEKDLVIPVQNLNSPKQLLDGFYAFQEREGELRTILSNLMPGYIQKAQMAIEKIPGICNPAMD